MTHRALIVDDDAETRDRVSHSLAGAGTLRRSWAPIARRGVARRDRAALRALAALLLAACRHPEAEPSPGEPSIQVRCVAPTIERRTRTELLRGVVDLAPGRHAFVAPQVPGRVLSVLVREGDAVRRGAKVAEVDARAARDAVTQARAALAGADAAVQNAASAAARTHDLLEHGIASRQEDEDATARLAAVRAQATAGRAALETANRALAFATVRAPLDGVVLRALRAAGDLVDGTPATPVIEVGDPTQLEFLASAVPADLVRLAVGQRGTARFEALPERAYAVTVRAIAPAIDPQTGVGAVRLAFAPGAGPPIGLAGVATVEVGVDEGVRMLPASALRGTPTGGSEVLTCEDGHLRARPVVLGVREGGHVEVKDGVPPGGRVVTDGVLGVIDGVAYTEAQ